MFCHALGVIKELSMNNGVSSWFHNVSTYSAKVIENNFFKFKIHLNKKNYNGIWAHSWYC